MPDNLYEDIKSLNITLRCFVSDDIYYGIDDVINYSSTPTEMLLKLKFNLSKIDPKNLDDEINSKIEAIKIKINDLLK